MNPREPGEEEKQGDPGVQAGEVRSMRERAAPQLLKEAGLGSPDSNFPVS